MKVQLKVKYNFDKSINKNFQKFFIKKENYFDFFFGANEKVRIVRIVANRMIYCDQ